MKLFDYWQTISNLAIFCIIFVFLWSTQNDTDHKNYIYANSSQPEKIKSYQTHKQSYIYSNSSQPEKIKSNRTQKQSYIYSNSSQPMKTKSNRTQKQSYIKSNSSQPEKIKSNRTQKQSYINSNSSQLEKIKSNRTQIFFRIAWYEQNSEVLFGISKYDPTKCNIPNCLVEKNTSLADIIVLRHSYLPYHKTIEKPKGQMWVLHTNESPYHTFRPPKQWADKIDLSASYMETSDFFVPLYGRLLHNKTYPLQNYTGVLANKTKDAVWVSSHCSTPSKRENLVKELSKHLTVDKYGKCGTKKCGKQYDDYTKCKAIFEKDYKFFFAFENSICDDYTTEKLYSLYRDHSPIIPVINGPRDVNKYLPKGTFINSREFSSPEKLAEKLKEIGSDESKYIRYLQEKDKYFLPSDFVERAVYKFQCDLCKYLDGLNNGSLQRKPIAWRKLFDTSGLCIPGK
ncbi:glycoprotein 3-alpha-L-fucosyltransferase A-like [Crassostrea angulata]|uniref:glycoprotein 3-alpha-L-fucosyltransferase A-like n=1 Tax=Magallana angulata TaxID=2784310 RepID=UPI0022B0CEDB|nr:glycoprotein 3-alpha-L-fucosyltransferase A-like [Crassostrea angulata]